MTNCACEENNAATVVEEANAEVFNHTSYPKCPAVGYQPLTVCVPVTITPFAKARPTTIYCCGDPIIIPGCDHCEGTVNGRCTFTLSQNICVAVPVDFGATSTVGAASVKCGMPTHKDICSKCCD